MFFYSERPKTLAERKFEDDIPLDVKKRRLAEVQAVQAELAEAANEKTVGHTYEVLIEGISKRSDDFVYGRNSQNLTVIFPREEFKAGDYVNVKIESFTSATVKGTAV
jgi:tRNA-2-methylthio-N6-dimethylallyladenosine synthase